VAGVKEGAYRCNIYICRYIIYSIFIYIASFGFSTRICDSSCIISNSNVYS
jgi:hypothetical protein